MAFCSMGKSKGKFGRNCICDVKLHCCRLIMFQSDTWIQAVLTCLNGDYGVVVQADQVYVVPCSLIWGLHLCYGILHIGCI